ncbi:uncharacterized protein LOC129778654 [Toxorhynchites rutilus septentrionalis]|uniref:uncharacterized protein LOC129778654 n=1 Tax=Toxorhynchites rutilus septentrionalis TaxID=329112 RepID=UPI00247B07F7|nr:uncharacterized protein LOC129778654 [Toxorhynchites rutilus septentrionalis]
MIRTSIVAVAIIAALIPSISGHGMTMDPVARGSRWRCQSSAPTNWDDTELWCGGMFVQIQNGGRCGMCGDNWAHPEPRRHELGGQFGQGEIVKNYTSGSVIDVGVRVTVNHLGFFVFNLCCLDHFGRETDACFNEHPLLDSQGRRQWFLNSTESRMYNVNLQLPRNLVCSHAVLQWTYTAGNNWGICPDGSGALGCGPQEHFRTCSDIGIFNAGDDRLANSFEYCVNPRSFDDDIPEEDMIHVI